MHEPRHPTTRFSKSIRSILVVTALAVTTASAALASELPPIGLVPVATGLDSPVYVTDPGDGRLFVVEQAGRIVIAENGMVREAPFLDLRSAVSFGGEQGLVGLAFDPAYADNGYFYVNYINLSGDTVVSRFSVSSDPNVANPSSEEPVLGIGQPFPTHNGGHLAFGPDGMLYISSGDGGSAGDPLNSGQTLTTLLGKILRIDVTTLPYSIPPSNPFFEHPTARSEIWAYGLRNPWRFSFDRATGDLFIGDVGQNRFEEIDFQAATSAGGENYGWRRMEGSRCFNPSSGCADESFVLPILEYDHSIGCSVSGGYVYRGAALPQLDGVYIFGDFCYGTLWGARPNGDGTWTSHVLLQTGLVISSFGEDSAGNVYLVDYDGSIFRIDGPPPRRQGVRRPGH